MDAIFAPENFRFKQMVSQESAPSAPLPMITSAFDGSGLQDLTPGTAYNQTAMATFVITIDGTGSPNTFAWSKTGGSGAASASGVSITGSAQTLSDGFQITFGATTGHTLSDEWTIKCFARARMYWDDDGVIQQIFSNGSSSTVGGGSPTGAAGGDLGGTYPNPTVAKINTITLGTVSATAGQILIGNGTTIASSAVSGDITINGSGVTAIGATKVTNAMLAGSIEASKLVGTDIVTVGTITSGTWNGTVIAGQYGGTGVANTGKTITLGGNLVTSGANSVTLTSTGATNVTLPTTGTLATLAGTESFSNKTFTDSITSTQGTITSSLPFINHTATLNNGATTFELFKSTITNTASASASKWINLLVSSTSRFSVDLSGQIVTNDGNGIVHQLGYLKVGHFFDAGTGYSGIANANMSNLNTEYAVLQEGLGATFINAKSGTTISFRLGNSELGLLSGTKWDFTAATTGVAKRNPHAAKTSNYTVLTTDSGGVFTNVNALGSVTFTLPSASAGLEYHFYVTDNQKLIVDAAGTDTIRLAASVTASGGNIASSTVGNALTVRYIGVGQWGVFAHEGTWTVT